jgi:predicted RecB family endonuclease
MKSYKIEVNRKNNSIKTVVECSTNYADKLNKGINFVEQTNKKQVFRVLAINSNHAVIRLHNYLNTK